MRDEARNIAILLGIMAANNAAAFFYDVPVLSLFIVSLGASVAIWWLWTRIT